MLRDRGGTFAITKKAGKEAQIIGMDLYPGQIKIAGKTNRFKHIRFIEGDVTNTDFKKGYFDKVFITHSLHEMPREDRLRTLMEANRILKAVDKAIVLELYNSKT